MSDYFIWSYFVLLIDSKKKKKKTLTFIIPLNNPTGSFKNTLKKLNIVVIRVMSSFESPN